jgi:cytochrome P450
LLLCLRKTKVQIVQLLQFIDAGTDYLLDFGIEPRRDVLQPLFGEGIFTQEGLHWKNSRNLIRRRLQHKHYNNLDIFQRAVDDLVQAIRSTGDVVDLQPLFFRMTLDISTEHLLGESAGSLLAPRKSNMRIFADAFDIVSRHATAEIRRYDLRWIVYRHRYQRVHEDLNRITDQILDRNLKAAREEGTGTTQHDFLCAITDDSQNRTALRGQVLHLLAAGRDTTASLLSWTL